MGQDVAFGLRLDLEELATLLGPAVVEAAARQAYKRALEYDAEWLHRRLRENEARFLMICCPPASQNIAHNAREIAERAFGPKHRITRLLMGWELENMPWPPPAAPLPRVDEVGVIRPDRYSLRAAEVAAILTELTRDEDARKGRQARAEFERRYPHRTPPR